MEKLLTALYAPGGDLSFWQKFKNLLYIFALNIIWIGMVFSFFSWLQPGADVRTLLDVPPMEKVMFNPLAVFFWSCIFAPFWEELVFRYFPAKLAKAIDPGNKHRFMIAMIFFSSIIFGLAHGSVANIIVQGVGGMFLFWIYQKNGLFWAWVSHFLWNFMVIFIMSTMF